MAIASAAKVESSTPATPIPTVRPAVVPVLNPSLLREAEYDRTRWVARVERAVDPKDLMAPNFWAHVANKLRPWDVIEAHCEDNSWYCELLVLDCSRTWAKVHCKYLASFSAPDIAATMGLDASGLAAIFNDFAIEHRGPKGWSVVRKVDGAVMQDGMGSREGAVSWLAMWWRENKPLELPK